MQWEGEGGGDFDPIPGMARGTGRHKTRLCTGWVGPPHAEFGHESAGAGYAPARILGLNGMSRFGSYFPASSILISLSMLFSKFSTRLLFNTKG